MSVYTAVPAADLNRWLSHYSVGSVLALEGIAAGVENTNYFLDTSGGRFVLTLFERIDADELQFYLALTHHLAERGLPVPGPVTDEAGRFFSTLCGKPAALVTRLAGRSVTAPDISHCAAIGDYLARMHVAAADFPSPPPRPRGNDWLMAARQRLSGSLERETLRRLDEELTWQVAQAHAELPRGIVHADLFHDNALFLPDGTLGGVIDFYFAGEDALLFDLAVTANDWCLTKDGLCPERTRALLAAYHAHRPLSEHEEAAWAGMLRAAALRFWVSRLEDLHLPRPGDLVLVKDPQRYRTILDQHATRTGFPWIVDPVSGQRKGVAS
jgi:homoserine kinase type II